GFTLLEMMISIAVTLIMVAAFYQLLTSFFQSYEIQDAIAEMQQQGRVTADLLSREILQAGYDPKGALFPPTGGQKTEERWFLSATPGNCAEGIRDVEPILEATPTLFHFLADLNENSSVDDASDDEEHIRYEWVGSSGIDLCGNSRKVFTVYRESGSGLQKVAVNIEQLQFKYYDGDGMLIPGVGGVLDQSQREKIAKVILSLTARTDRQDSTYLPNGGYRTREFTSEIWLKNM
ncbi:MAG: PilW family protein, partial [Nitrospiria bacterium]